MTTTLQRSDTARAVRGGWRPLLMRLHFYAGVLVAPFLLVAAVTGLLCTVAPQVDRVLHGDELRTAAPVTDRLPVSAQVAAATAAAPGLEVASVQLPEGDRATTRVVFEDPSLTDDRQRTVYVDPGTGMVRGQLITWFGSTPAVTLLDDLHRNLLVGEIGRHYSELAASWLWVVVLGGVVLWLGRRRTTRRVRRALLPDLSARGRRRTLSWHGSTGLVLAVGLLFLSVTGLTWSRYAGEHFSTALVAVNATAPELDTALPGTTTASSSLADIDRVVAGAGLAGPVEIIPALDGTAWSVQQTDSVWPVRQDAVAVDPATGSVVAATPWSDRPALSKLSTLGVDAHMGILFGPVNQVLLAGLALGLICVIVWGYRAWWQRRPSRSSTLRTGRPPRRGAWRGLPLPQLALGLAVAAAVGWALPALGATLLAFVVLDALLGLRHAPAADEPSRVQAEDTEEQLLV